MRSSFFILVLSVVFGKAIGQQTNTPDITQQLWMDFNPQYQINSKFIVSGRFDVRTIYPQSWYQFITGAGIAYKRNPFWDKKAEEEFHGGIGFFYTINIDAPNRFEIRPYQGYRLRWPNFTRFTLQNYVRLEERFEFTGDGDDEDFGLRLRYQVEGIFRCKNCDNSFLKPLYLLISDEFFFNLNGTKQFNDLIRIGPGLGYGFPSGWRPEFDFIFNRSRQTVEEEFTTSNVIFRFRIFYKIPENKNKKEK